MLLSALPVISVNAKESGVTVDLLYSHQEEGSTSASDNGGLFNLAIPLADSLEMQLRHATTQISTAPKLSGTEKYISERRGEFPLIDSWSELRLYYHPQTWIEGLSIGLSWQSLEFEQLIDGYQFTVQPLSQNTPIRYRRDVREDGYGAHLSFHNRLGKKFFYRVELEYIDVHVDDVVWEFQAGYDLTPSLSLVAQIRDFEKFSISFHEIGLRYHF